MKDVILLIKRHKLFIRTLIIILLSILTGCASIAWNKAANKDTIGGYNKYIKDYPNSTYVQKAKGKIKLIENEEQAAKKILSTYQKGSTSYDSFESDFPEYQREKPWYCVDIKGYDDWRICGNSEVPYGATYDHRLFATKLKVDDQRRSVKNTVLVHEKKIAELEFKLDTEDRKYKLSSLTMY